MRLSASSALAWACLASTAFGTRLQDHADQFWKRKAHQHAAAPAMQRPNYDQKRCEDTFLTDKTKPFEVNGTGIPEVDFDVGESYAGLLPISGNANETRKLFFWFFPSTDPAGRNKTTIWFNGGPGCSSLHGLLTEFGPFTWQDGTEGPVANPYTWTNLTNMIFVEQPVGVGFTQGTPNISNEDELAQQFLGFYEQFVNTFDLHGGEVYVAGESYAGMYVSYVANAFVLADNLDYANIKGVAINDGLIGNRVIQQNAAISPFADYWDKLFFLNDTYKQQMHDAHEACGFADYMEKYLTYPAPQEPFVLPPQLQNKSLPCDLYDDVVAAATLVNPCFNLWHVTETCPRPSRQLGKVFPDDYQPASQPIYFNRTDVQKAINVPVGTNWEQCTSINVFGGPSQNQSANDTSISPGNDGVLQRVIEYTNNTFIGSGDLDYILSTNSTLLAIQNITWNGYRGFKNAPTMPFYAPYHIETSAGASAGAGHLGSWGSERGLTFYHIQLSGHELPGYAAGAAYRMVEVMLGRVANMSVVGEFTTQSGHSYGNGQRQVDELNQLMQKTEL